MQWRKGAAIAAAVTAGFLLTGGEAEGQGAGQRAGQAAGKPPPLDAPAPAPAPPSVLPRRANPTPPPAAAAPSDGTDKFGEARPGAPAPGTVPESTDKFGQAPAPTPAPATPAPAAPPASPPATATAPPPVPVPENEPPTVARLRQLLPAGTQLTYRSVEVVDPLTGSVRLRGASLIEQAATITAEEVLLESPSETGVAVVSARDLAVRSNDGGTGTLARFELRNLVVRPPAPGAQLAPDAVSFDLFRIEGFAFQQSDVQVRLGEASAEGFGAGRPTRFSLSGVDVTTPQSGIFDRVQVARASMRGIDVVGLVATISRGETPGRVVGNYALDIEDVAVTLEQRPVGGLASLSATGEVPPTGAESGRLALRGLRVDASPAMAPMLGRFGYTQGLTGDLTLDTRFDRDAGRMEIRSLALGVRDAGALGLSLTVDGVTPERMQALDYSQIRFVGLELRYADQSLYGRMVRDEAQRRRQNEQQVRDRFARDAARALAAGGAGAGPLSDPLQRFLRGQATEIEIALRPPQPLSADQLQALGAAGPQEMQRRLGLTATAR